MPVESVQLCIEQLWRSVQGRAFCHVIVLQTTRWGWTGCSDGWQHPAVAASGCKPSSKMRLSDVLMRIQPGTARSKRVMAVQKGASYNQQQRALLNMSFHTDNSLLHPASLKHH